ncbi:hypothetical protein M2351_007119 [Azospirillum canadense]|nr:hypothetical protein [Azospirillum canadense]
MIVHNESVGPRLAELLSSIELCGREPVLVDLDASPEA